jgi:glycosyltransferase involved in cell wall biosynthesis
VKHDLTGLLVTPGDTQELAAAMDVVLERHDMVAALARTGRQYVLENFSPESAARRYMDIYSHAIGKP